ncbi:MAG: hypothetical protein ABSG22_10385 [Sedimentisphaerales bacterium]
MRQKTEDRRRPLRPFGTGEISPKAEKTERLRRGSAIILAIVLTTLLAMLGVLFLLSSRVDSVATSGVGDNQDLKLAVDTVVAQISEVLTHNVPGVDPNGTYYNYPDANNPWLACLEPYQSGSNYFWRQVSNIYGPPAWQIVQAQVLPEYQPATPNTLADADGDGVSDSIWVQVPGKASSKGKPIYAAVRIIDNGGMLNINTGYKFDPCGPIGSIDGSSQTQINLLALANRPFYALTPADIQARADYLNNYRCGTGPNDITSYASNVVWKYDQPVSPYTPFDISDELELRYRFLVNQTGIDTRSEVMTNWEIGRKYDFQTPINSASDLNEWFRSSNSDYVLTDPNYAYRHIATTYNMDRVINPAGNKMFNINSPLNFNKDSIYKVVREALDPNVFSSADVAQITANLMDYIDGPDYNTWDPRYDPNNEVTEVNDSFGTPHYGFERPCVYISEIAQNFYQPGPNDPNVYRSYAIELFKPYWEDDEPNGWRIVTTDSDGYQHLIPIIWTGSRRFHVLANMPNTTVPEANIPIVFNDIPGPNDFNGFDPNKFNYRSQPADVNFGGGTDIILQRNVNGFWLQVDTLLVPDGDVNGSSWLEPNIVGYTSHSFERDITLNKCIRKILNPNMTTPTIGSMNHPFNSGGDMIQAHPANKMFTNVGEIGQLFRTDAYLTNEFSTEAEVRLNLADLYVQNLFKYLTVMDPYDHNQPAETKIKGRINIDTAPWFVLAQLPWVTYHTQPNYNLAQSIVNYRDTIHGPFKNIGELMTDANNSINSIGYYIGRGSAIPTTLLTPTDMDGVGGVGDAFEERDVIFDRISNLITVRSDVFTAYILVRIGTDGPQKRVVAIFDRSGVTPTGGKVKIVAIQQVPDPR